MPDNPKKVLRQVANWKNLYFYQKSDALYQMTYVFCKRFLPEWGDRTVDQMVQAARSGKQNIVEGSEDGMTSSEIEIRLINVARSSLEELQADYMDYIKSRQLTLWTVAHHRYDGMLRYCRAHNNYSDYEPYVELWNEEEFCNTALTLCHMTDRMMCSYLERLEKRFVTEGGIKERMYAARTGYRKGQDEQLLRLKRENEQLRAAIARLQGGMKALKAIDGQKG